MMRILMSLIVLVLIMSSCSGNKKPKYEKIRYERYQIPIEGGVIRMQIDSIAPLNHLVESLEYDSDLYETGKGYWIGYNDLMFSIAIHSDGAIQSLLNFIKNSTDIETKSAACYTLHLIGIKCKVVDRYREEFHNKNAREALLSLLDDDELQPLVMELLIRDPWTSDIPVLMNTMNKSSTDCWAISNGLLLYGLEEDIPFELHVPDSIKKLDVKIPDIKGGYTKQEFINTVFAKMKDIHSDALFIEDTFLSYNFRYDPVYLGDIWRWDDGLERKNINILGDRSKISVGELVEHVSWMGYCDLGNNYLYTMKDRKLHIMSPKTTKSIWLDWWNAKSGTYKKDLMSKNYSQRKFHGLQLH